VMLRRPTSWTSAGLKPMHEVIPELAALGDDDGPDAGEE
jgi:hypothetical protein